jgi:tetratricopeptide (TPR) repeat protein
MPTTYNGIGTHYYGKKNLQKRNGVCRSCGHSGELQSYDTRLWFVVLFIPIIPLGRKRILDACPNCRRHYVSQLDRWETSRQLEVSGAMEKFRANPTPETAIAAHQQMVGFHQITEAREFEKKMLAQFPDSAKMLAYLGAAHAFLGQEDTAADFFQRALDLRPDMPEARTGVARGLIRAGKLDAARAQLEFLEKPGAEQLYSLELLETLAHAYQKAGRHQEALDLFGIILRALPKAGEHAGFRKQVKKSEKALGTTILPKQKFSLKRLFQSGGTPAPGRLSGRKAVLVFGVLLALFCLAMIIANEYIRRHRQLHIVNAYSAPATVKISGRDPIRGARGMTTISLPEGHYHAAISGPVTEEVDFDIRDSYFNRWSGDPLWLLNVGGAAVLERIDAVYSQNPQPPRISFHFGNRFEHFDSVTHPFQSLPDSISVSSGGTRELVGLELYKGEGVGIFQYLQNHHGSGDPLKFAESWLSARPNDVVTLHFYAADATAGKQDTRLDAFLRAGLTNRPVRIQWHRLYQSIHDRPAEHAAMVADYDALLAADPDNSALLYLRGRLEPNRAAARDYFQRSTNAAPKNPFPLFALGHDRAVAGDWTNARPLLAEAAALAPTEPGFASMLFSARLALGEAAALEQEARQTLGRKPFEYEAAVALIDTLAAQNRPDEALKAAGEYAARCRNHPEPEYRAAQNGVRYRALYVTGDFAGLEAAAQADATEAGPPMRLVALLEQDRLAEAGALLETNRSPGALVCWSAALAHRKGGNEAAARLWQARALEQMRDGKENAAAVAQRLAAGEPLSVADAKELTLAPQLKAVVLATLALQSPQEQAGLTALARELNVERDFPYHLVQRATAP